MPDAVMGRLVSAIVTEDGSVLVTVNRGTDHGVAFTWVGKLMDGAEVMAGGTFELLDVHAREARGQVQLTIERVAQCTAVWLAPS